MVYHPYLALINLTSVVGILSRTPIIIKIIDDFLKIINLSTLTNNPYLHGLGLFIQ
jgi:hypothetical protein